MYGDSHHSSTYLPTNTPSQLPQLRCPDEKIAKYLDIRLDCGKTGNSKLWHRGCCHNLKKVNEKSLTPLKAAIEAALKKMKKPGKSKTVDKVKKISHLLKRYRTALTEESKFQNDQFDTG
jgi:hypothetical protein